MREVLFKKWIPAEYEKKIIGQGRPTPITGTGCFANEFTEPAIFLSFGLDVEEFNNSAASYTVAILEKSDGTVFTCHLSNFKFVHHGCEN